MPNSDNKLDHYSLFQSKLEFFLEFWPQDLGLYVPNLTFGVVLHDLDLQTSEKKSYITYVLLISQSILESCA